MDDTVKFSYLLWMKHVQFNIQSCSPLLLLFRSRKFLRLFFTSHHLSWVESFPKGHPPSLYSISDLASLSFPYLFHHKARLQHYIFEYSFSNCPVYSFGPTCFFSLYTSIRVNNNNMNEVILDCFEISSAKELVNHFLILPQGNSQDMNMRKSTF